MKSTLIELHQAAQYLAAAGICFVEHQADDSHTNLGWDAENKRLVTHFFSSDKYQLSLVVESSKLEWLQNGKLAASIDLSESTHLDNLTWIKARAEASGLAPYMYRFHYDLPFPALSDEHVFFFDVKTTNLITSKWDMGKKAFEGFLMNWRFDSPIRLWPHHFDLGFYLQMDKAGTLFMVGGLAVPDSLVDDLYFYVSGSKNGKAVNTKEFGILDIGEWRSDWDGATLAASNMNVNLVILFLKLTHEAFLENN